MIDRSNIKKKLISLFKESLSNNNADNKHPADPYGRGPCPHCKEFAVGTYRHRGAPVFCKNNHKWGGSCGHLDEDCMNTPLKELEGGLSQGKTLQDIAIKHEVPISKIKGQVEKGIDSELEHTDDPKIASDIAKDHEVENPEYYDDLEAADIEEQTLNEMPYIFNVPDRNGQPLDLQLEKWTTEEEFKSFLITLFSGETYADTKQPLVQLDNPEKFIKILTDFSDDLHNPATQLLVQFTRKFRANGRKVTLKTLSPDDINYLKRFIIDAYNKSKENIS